MTHDKRAIAFKNMRREHESEAAEDYTELVADLISDKGVARTCDIAAHLGISHVTALRTIRRLQEQGYLETAPHKPVSLTKRGAELAIYCKERHEILVEFFENIGVPKDQAELDVEGVEHHISDVTLGYVKKFLNSKK